MTLRSWARKLFGRKACPLTTPPSARHRVRLALEALEDRLAPATFTVVNLNDSGDGSLRQAISDANSNPGADHVVFQEGLTGTITLTDGQLQVNGDLTITGPGAADLTIDANHASRVLGVGAGVAVELSGLTLANGNASDSGGGIYNSGTLTVSNSTFSGNSASSLGGGIYTLLGTLTVSNSTFSENSAGFLGGGIYMDRCTVTVSNSTFSGNSAASFGGGIGTFGGTMAVSNSTFSGNSAGFNGGGIGKSSGTMAVSNSTFSGNSAGSLGGGIHNVQQRPDQQPTLTINNSIVANSSSGGDIFGSYVGNNNLTGTVALGPLQNNGGPTMTHALPVDSPAINAGDNTLVPDGLTADQRGAPFVRVIDGTVDIGAFEFHSAGFSGLSSPPITYGTASVVLSGHLSAGLMSANGEVSITLNGLTQQATLDANGDFSTIFDTATLGAGDYPVAYSYAADTYFTAATGSSTLTVSKATPTLTWADPAAITYGTALSAAQLNATADVDGVEVAGTFTYSLADGTALNVGTVLNAGSHTLRAEFTPSDTANYNSVSTDVTLTVDKADPTVTWPTPGPITYGTPLSAIDLNGRAVTLPDAGFETPDASTANSGSLYNPPLNPDQGQPWSFSDTPGNGAGVAHNGSWVTSNQLAPVGNQVAFVQQTGNISQTLNLAAGTYTVSFLAAQRANNPVTASTQEIQVLIDGKEVGRVKPSGIDYVAYTTGVFTVMAGEHTLRFQGLNPQGGDNTAFLDQIDIAPGVAGTFAFDLPPDIVLNAGTHTLSATFTPSDTANYNSASADVTLTVGQATPTFSALFPSGIVYGTATATLSGHLGAGSVHPPQGALVDVTLDGVTQQATLDANGDFSTIFDTATLGAGDYTVGYSYAGDSNFQAATGSGTLSVSKATQTITWAAPAAIDHGTLLSSAQLNATVAVVGPSPAGALTYSPAAGTLLDVGDDQILSVTAAETPNYQAATATVTIDVLDRAPTDVGLSTSRVAENQPVNTVVGHFSTSDPDAGDTFSYSLVPGAGSDDNASFAITVGTLQTAASFDFESKSSYSIRVRSTDQGGLSVEKAFTITIGNINEAPVLGVPASARILERVPYHFTATAADPDLPAGTLTFSLRNAPAGASINPATGVFSFTPPHNGTFTFDVVVSDHGSPALSVAQTVSLTTRNSDVLAVGADAGGVPEVRVYDTATRALKLDFLAYDAGFTGGVRVATGDVTGDGIPDIITGAGAGAGPHVKVFDGVSGVAIRSFFAYGASFSGGVFVTAGDVNGDGRADLITGAGAGAGPHVKVFDGATGAELRSFFAYDAGFTGGVSVAGGDINGDGRADLITGAGPGAGPHVKVFDGVTGAELRSFYAYGAGFSGGVFVAGGDVDGDGCADIVTGAGPGGGAAVRLFSGRTGTLLRSLSAAVNAGAAGVRVAVTDLNSDGRGDVAAASDRGPAPFLTEFDGTNVTAIDSLFALGQLFRGGLFVAG